MRPVRISEVLRKIITNRWPAFIWGPPGAGKSSVVAEVASELKRPLRDIRAPLLDPTDLRGIPAIKDGRAVWCPPAFLPTPDEDPGILFFDELNAAPPLVQASLYQLTLDRKVGEYELPDGWSIIAAGNRAEDRAITFRMPSALANRFIHIDFEVNLDDWRRWAAVAGVHPLVTAFLSMRPELLYHQGKDAKAFPTPRSWEMVSDTIAAIGSIEAANDVLGGIIGEGPAHEFLGYCEHALKEEVFIGIVERPETEPLPDGLGELYALVSYLVHRGTDRSVRRAAEVLLDRLPPEFSVLLARDLGAVEPAFCRTDGYRKLVAEHRDAIA